MAVAVQAVSVAVTAHEAPRCNASEPVQPLNVTMYRHLQVNLWARMLAATNAADAHGEAELLCQRPLRLINDTLVVRWALTVDSRWGRWGRCGRFECQRTEPFVGRMPALEHRRPYPPLTCGPLNGPRSFGAQFAFPPNGACKSGASLGTAGCTYTVPSVDKAIMLECLASIRTPAFPDGDMTEHCRYNNVTTVERARDLLELAFDKCDDVQHVLPPLPRTPAPSAPKPVHAV